MEYHSKYNINSFPSNEEKPKKWPPLNHALILGFLAFKTMRRKYIFNPVVYYTVIQEIDKK